MAKEKRRLIDEKEQETTLFYYEIIGSLAIIFSITVLGKLGKIGNVFTTFFKVGFGDWYWLIILFVLFFGFFSLFMHQKFDFKSHRFIGFLFITFAILTYSHFPIHEYVSSSSTSYFSGTWAIYRNFINTGSFDTLGGGMIGAIIFYAMYYLLGSVGVILLGIILIVLGLSLIFNKSLKEICIVVIGIFKNFGKYFSSFNKFFRYEVGKDIGSEKEETVRSKENDVKKKGFDKKIRNNRLPLKILSDNKISDNIFVSQQIIIEDYNKIIQDFLYSKSIYYKTHKKIISYYVYTLMYVIYSTVDYMEIFKQIKDLIKEETLFSIDENIIIIQINATDKRTYSLKQAITEMNNYINDDYILGKDYKNESITVDLNKECNLLLLGLHYVGIKNMIYSLLLQSLIKKNYNNYEFMVYDTLDSYKEFKCIFSYIDTEIFPFLDEIKIKIDERLELFRQIGVNSYLEYLKKVESSEIENKIPKVFIIINEISSFQLNSPIDEKEKYNIFESKLMYILQLSKKVGFSVIYVVRKNLFLNNVIYSIFDNKLVFKCDKELINSFIKNTPSVLNNSLFLDGFGDSYFIHVNEYIRLLPPKISKEDVNNVVDYLKGL